MGTYFSTLSDPNPSSPDSSHTMSSSSKSSTTHDPKSKLEPTHESKPEIKETHESKSKHEPTKNPQEGGGKDPKLVEETGEEEEEEEGECGFCLFMKAGGCKDTFTEWEKCIEEGEKNKEDIVEKCFQVTSALKKCMDEHSDYYAPILQAEKAAEAEAVKEFEKEREKEKKEKEQGNEINKEQGNEVKKEQGGEINKVESERDSNDSQLKQG